MKRESVALLLHPFKNALMPREELRESMDAFVSTFIDISTGYPNIRWNLVLPGYFLELIDPLLLQKLRDLHRRGALEWLTTGYTEPFLSLSPPAMTNENIRLGVDVFTRLTGFAPSGYVPPFSNWEPSHIERLRSAGLNYVVLSQALFPEKTREYRGLWVTEHAGTSIVLFSAQMISPAAAPDNIITWLDTAFEHTPQWGDCARLATIDCLVPLAPFDRASLEWIRAGADALEKHLLQYQCVRFADAVGPSHLWGVQYVPPGLVYKREDSEAAPYFLNYLHTFDQVGILQRKLMNLWERVSQLPSKTEPLIKQLFFVQDVNRLLPGKQSGFIIPSDRLWSYERMIEIEEILRAREQKKGGAVRIFDFLKTGGKNVVLSNNTLTVYIDHHSGGHVFELDHIPTRTNLCSGYNSLPHALPAIVVPGKSKTAFVDHIVAPSCSCEDFSSGKVPEIGDFTAGKYDYKIHKVAHSIKTSLMRTGSVVQGDKSLPLSIEKMFGLDADRADLSFVYQLFSHSLVSFVFRLAVESTFLLPGATQGAARLVHGRSSKPITNETSLSLGQVTSWSLVDFSRGLRLKFITQKPVDLWCFPADRGGDGDPGYQGTTMVISSMVQLDEGATWSLIGKCEIHKTRKRDACDRKLWI